MDVIARYQRRLSGPLADRFDLHLDLKPVGHSRLLSAIEGTSTDTARGPVDSAIMRQKARFPDSPDWQNSHLAEGLVADVCQLSDPLREFLEDAANSFSLSNRGLFKALKVARTIADLDDAGSIEQSHLCEALSYRRSTIQ